MPPGARRSWGNNNMQMPFGKYEGEELEDIPVSYLRWLRANVELYGELEEEVEYILSGDDDDLFNSFYRKENRSETTVVDLKEIRSLYRRLSLKWHPDTGGNTQAMQALNEYTSEIEKLVN